MRVFVTRPIPAPSLDLIRRALPDVELDVHPATELSGAMLVEKARGCPAIIATLADPMNRETLTALPDLRHLAQFAVGTNNIDLDAARDLGICVTHTPGVLTDATAELAVALVLAGARRLVEGHDLTRGGRFDGWAPLFHLGTGVHGKTVGVVGAGRIGRRFGEIMERGFHCRVLYASRTGHLPLAEVLARSDFVSLHCPLTPQTRHLIDETALALMKPTAWLINTSRGAVVDEDALVRALRAGTIAGAALDVYEREPVLADGLAGLPNAVLLPHLGSATVEAREAMGRLCAEAVIDVLSGREPTHRVV